MAKAKPVVEEEFADDAEIASGDRDHVLMRWRDPKEEKISGGISCGGAEEGEPTVKYAKRADGAYVVHRRHVNDLRAHGLEVVG